MASSELEAARKRVAELSNQVTEAKAGQEAAIRASDEQIEMARLATEEQRLKEELAGLMASTSAAESGDTVASTLEQITATTRVPDEDAPPLGTVVADESPATLPRQPASPTPSSPPVQTPTAREEQ